MTTIVRFEVTAEDSDLTMRVVDAIGKGFKKEFGKRKVLVGTPKDRDKVPADAVVIAPYEIKAKV